MVFKAVRLEKMTRGRAQNTVSGVFKCEEAREKLKE
jgi:hypothetical protein